jgi:molecular chaperone HscB
LNLSQNYFELFDLEIGFALDRTALDSAYLELQKEYHPDRFAHKGDAEQRLAVQNSTHLNTAYEALKSPLLRAQYLLSLRGVLTGEESRKQLPMDFLMQQMELRETLAEAPEATDPFATLEALESQTKALEKICFDDFQLAYSDGDLDQAEQSVRKLQFLKKLLSEIEAMEDRLDEEF